MVTSGRPPPGDLALLALAVAGVSTAGPLIRQAGAPPLPTAFWRNALGALVVLLIVAARPATRRELAELSAAQWRACGVAGGFLACHFALWITSLSYTTVAASIALVSTTPVWSAVLARLQGQRVSRQVWAGIALVSAGTLTVTGADLAVSPRALAGDALAVAGGVAMAATLAIGAQARRNISTPTFGAVLFGSAALALLPLAVVFGRPVIGYPARTWFYLGALTLFAQLLGHFMFARVLRGLSPTIVGVAALGEIVGSGMLAWAWLDEAPPVAVIPAAVLIGIGIVLVVRAPGISGGPRVPRIPKSP